MSGGRRTVDDVPRISAGLVVYRRAPREPVAADERGVPGAIPPDGPRAAAEPPVAVPPDGPPVAVPPLVPDEPGAAEPTVADPLVVPDAPAPLDLRAPETSLGLRTGDVRVEVLCAHMGGPLWARKDERAWSFPKGELEEGEDEPAGARREFAEELGLAAPDEPWWRLGEYRYSSGKRVVLFAVEADLALDAVRPGTFEMEWPPRSGRRQEFPEVDRVAWFDVPTARTKLVAGQVPALDDLERRLAAAW